MWTEGERKRTRWMVSSSVGEESGDMVVDIVAVGEAVV